MRGDPDLFFRNPGELPCSLNLSGGAYRYQKDDYIFEDECFWKAFQEGSWKWKSQQRFSGVHTNIGHYFAFTKAGARAELSHYVSGDLSDYKLLHMLCRANSILDLTQPENFASIYRHFELSQYIPENRYEIDLICEVFDAKSGGGIISDLIGWQAVRRGYNGILYPSIRSQPDNIQDYVRGYPNPNLYMHQLGDMFKEWYGYCVVIFSASYLLTNTSKYLYSHRYEMNRGIWKDNPFYKNPDKLHMYFDDEDRLTKIGRVRWYDK